MLITSTQNPRILRILRLAKSRNRHEANLFVIEGIREIRKALAAGFSFESVFFCPDIISSEGQEILEMISPTSGQYEVNRHVFGKIAYRDNKDGLVVIGVAVYKQLKDYVPAVNPLILVLETVEKPGNLGALLRTADAAGLDAVLVCDPQTDIYNPNVIRSSLGCVFTTCVIPCFSDEAIKFLKNNGIRIYSTALQTEILYTSIDYRGASAIVLGSEAEGLTAIWRENADALIKIPMSGEADSLNVSVSAGVVVFEGVRQRREMRF